VLADDGQLRQRGAARDRCRVDSLQDRAECGAGALRMRHLRRQRGQQSGLALRRIARLQRVV